MANTTHIVMADSIQVHRTVSADEEGGQCNSVSAVIAIQDAAHFGVILLRWISFTMLYPQQVNMSHEGEG